MELAMRVIAVPLAALLALCAVLIALVPVLLRARQAPAPQPELGTVVSAIPLAGGAGRPVLTLRGQFGFPTVTADGSALLLEKALPTATEVWRAPLDGSTPSRVGQMDVFTSPAWSPDGHERASADGTLVAIERLDASHIRTLTKLRGYGGFSTPSWGGNFIAFERQSRPATGWRLDLEVWNASGSRAWRAAVPFAQGALALASDGRRVAVVAGRTLSLVTPHSRIVLATDARKFWPPLWTVDQRSLVYFDQFGRVVVLDVATGSKRVVANGASGEIALSPDGRTIYLARVNDAVSIPK
jgi:Tol biopolymer transport system component